MSLNEGNVWKSVALTSGLQFWVSQKSHGAKSGEDGGCSNFIFDF
jgi:hypothetical protein